MNKQDILNAFMFRHACKDFDTSRKINDDDFDYILELGRLSPSSFGFEPWQFLVVQNPDLREKLKEHTWGGQDQIPHGSHLVVFLARKASTLRYDKPYLRHIMADVQGFQKADVDMRTQFVENFQKNDFKLLENEQDLFHWASRQVYIALGNMMSGAAMIGIDSCPMEGFSREQIDRVLAEEFNMDTDEFGVAVMCAFGYRVKEPRDKTRRPAGEVVTWYR